jgi:hypothetical protein
MGCIDCHTGTGLMGDGRQHDELEDQVDITCRTCHSPRLSQVTDPESPAKRLVFLNKKVPAIGDRSIAISKKGTPLYNLQERKGGLILFRKRDGQAIEMKGASHSEPHHRLPGHNRLSCQACHSAWIPQCYGCHLTYRRSENQIDWLSGKSSPGRWKEGRSYVRFSNPALGFRKASAIYPISPCQVFVSVFDEENRFQKDRSINVLTFSAFDPHTTSTQSRPCAECHGDPKALGLGEGILHKEKSGWVFRSTYDSAASGLGLPFALDSFVTVDGTPLQATSRKDTRPFNKEEIANILSVLPCLGCHDRYDDKIYKDFAKAKRRFKKQRSLPCRK